MHIYRRLLSRIGDKLSPYCCCLENENNLSFKGKEMYVGIQEYVGNHLKFNAFVKHRSSHFHVHEIGLDGKIVQLTDLEPPVDLPPNEPYHVHCTLYKDGVAAPEVFRYLSDKLRIDIKDVRMAGIKDKWGRTTQKISIYNVKPQQLVELSQKNSRIKLGNFTYSAHPIETGDLSGNHFKILLQNVQSCEDSSFIIKDIDKAVTSLKDFGFINYYGLQRFSFGHKNQIVGKYLLQMKFEEAFDLLLQPSKNDSDVMREAKSIWLSKRDTMKIAEIIFPYQNQNSTEYLLFKALAEHYNKGKGELVKVFHAVRENASKMCYSSFKSFLWNHLVSYRLRTFGHKPIPGDIVNLQTARNKDTNASLQNLRRQIKKRGRVEGDDCNYLTHEIKVLTENDFDSNGNCDYSIYDVLLGSPGTRMTKYENRSLQNYFEMLLRANELEFDCFSKFGEIYYDHLDSHSRAFRHIMLKPQQLNYKIVPQNSFTNSDTCISSDWDLLQYHNSQCQSEGKKNSTLNTNSKKEVELGVGKINVIVEFSLPKSTYATMALRELLDSHHTKKKRRNNDVDLETKDFVNV